MKYTTLLGFLGTSELIAVSSLACEINVVGANNAMDAARIAGVQRVYNVAKPHFDGYDEDCYTLNQHAGELMRGCHQTASKMLAVEPIRRCIHAPRPLRPRAPPGSLADFHLILCDSTNWNKFSDNRSRRIVQPGRLVHLDRLRRSLVSTWLRRSL
jgi:hypothetical protein